MSPLPRSVKERQSVTDKAVTPARSRKCNGKGIVRSYRQLSFVSEVLLKELDLEHKDVPKFKLESTALETCQGLVTAWKAYLGSLKKLVPAQSRFLIQSYDKGVRSLFDYQCEKCDKGNERKVISAWWERVSVPGTTPASVLRNIRRYARFVLGTKSMREWKRERRVEVFGEREDDIPNGMACYEKKRSEGGTFAAGWERDDSTHPGKLRVTSVKSKGKYRVVTCQPAFVKRKTKRVMTYFYDRLTDRNDWLVRGDVKIDHFLTLGRPKEGELYTSGDFSASTDYLHLDAVLEVVAAMCEVVDEETADVLMRSFKDIECDGYGRVRRGSMMGSNCSFVVLCVLNAFVVDNAIGNVDEKGFVSKNPRPKLINGDDAAFIATEEEFSLWQRYSAWVGFRVNLDKTGRSRRYVEINSQVYDSDRRRFIPKPSFGYLNGGFIPETKGIDDGEKEWIEDPWDALFKTITHGIARNATRMFILGHHYTVWALSGTCRPNLLSIPRRWHTWLFKKRWFRKLMEADNEVEVREETKMILDLSSAQKTIESFDYPCSCKRTVPYAYGPCIENDLARDLVERAEKAFMTVYKRKWDGVVVRRCREGKVRSDPLVRPHSSLVRGGIEGKRLWIKPIWNWYNSRFGERCLCRPTGLDAVLHSRDDPKVKLFRPSIPGRNDRSEFGPPVENGWIGFGDKEGKFRYRVLWWTKESWENFL
nr:MAG: RNA-dependent RNA polymerase [Fusarium oxysporum f. sp. cubense ourmia-like virus 2]